MAYNPGSGYRWSRGYGNGHYGQDWGADKGTAISVAADGVVVLVTEQPLGANGKSWGKYVVVMHTGTDGNAYYTLYAHMSNNQIVKEGYQVSKGQKIGEVGNTGVGTGDHLHFEVRPTDKPLTDSNGDGVTNWEDANKDGNWFSSSKPVNPFTFNWDPLGGAYNYIDVFLRDFAISHGLLRLLTDTNTFDPDGLLDKFGIPNDFSRYFTRATQWRPSREPLTLDLDGDGIETVGINTNNPILFDHDGDGVKTATGWIKKKQSAFSHQLSA